LSLRTILATGATLMLSLALPAAAGAGFTPIGVGDDFFSPSTIGQPVSNAEFHWAWNDNVDSEHNVFHESRLFRSGAPTDDPAARYPADGNIELPAGKYLYFCEIHSPMTGDIRIIPSAAAPESGVVEITWAQDSDARVGDRWQVQFRRGEEGPWRTWKKNTDDFGGGFGANDKPVNFNSNRAYQVRVKTKLRSNPDRQSRFSPPLSFGAIR
jgi:hypothetical protein